MENMEIRTAEIADRNEILGVLDNAFSDTSHYVDFGKLYPHLFRDERIKNHQVAILDGKIIGVAGFYPMGYKWRGVEFEIGGIGQVATLHEMRGRGVMSQVIKKICQIGDSVDFSFLLGSRFRYGNYGWEKGGGTMRWCVDQKFIEDPGAESDFIAIEPKKHYKMIKTFINKLPHSCLPTSEQELVDILESSRFDGCPGWILDDAFVVVEQRSNTVMMFDGSVEQLTRLFGHALRDIRQKKGPNNYLFVECSPENPLAMDAAKQLAADFIKNFPTSQRIGKLYNFLEKFAYASAGIIPEGKDVLCLRNVETGEAVRIEVQSRKMSVSTSIGDEAVVCNLSRRDLSALLLGSQPPRTFIPELSPSSPLNSIFPMPVHVAKMFWI